MARKEPRCGLCGSTLACDNCGPIEGGMVWIRKGEKTPSPRQEGAEGDLRWVCERCFRGKPTP